MTNKSTQRVYNTIEEGYIPSPVYLSLSLPLPVLAQLSFLFIRKRRFCLVLSHLAVNWNLLLHLPYSYSLPLLSFHSKFTSLLSFCSLCATLQPSSPLKPTLIAIFLLHIYVLLCIKQEISFF